MSAIFTPEAIALGIAVGALAGLTRAAWPWVSRLVHLVDDLGGTPERPGVDARPGVMERLAKVEEAADTAVYNTQPNGGGSPHDSLVRQIGAVGDALAVHVEQSKTWVREVDRTLDGHGIDTPPWPTDNP